MIRNERPEDERAIAALIEQAFRNAQHSDGTESAIVDRLRAARALTLSLVFADDAQIVGHVAFSGISISMRENGWYGLGPVAVDPSRQRNGIGTALIDAGLAMLRQSGAGGCVVLGDPAYYARFDFRNVPPLRYPPAPAEYFQALVWSGGAPAGDVTYHPAFG